MSSTTLLSLNNWLLLTYCRGTQSLSGAAGWFDLSSNRRSIWYAQMACLLQLPSVKLVVLHIFELSGLSRSHLLQVWRESCGIHQSPVRLECHGPQRDYGASLCAADFSIGSIIRLLSSQQRLFPPLAHYCTQSTLLNADRELLHAGGS